MAVQASDVLTVIKSRPAAIPDGSTDAVIQSYIDEAKVIMLEYCTLPLNIQAVPDALKYPWAEIAMTLLNGVSALTTGQVTRVKEDDTEMQFGNAKNAQAQLFDNLSVNNVRIMNRFRHLF